MPKTLAEYPGALARYDRDRNPLPPEEAAISRPHYWRCDAGPDHRWGPVVLHDKARVRPTCAFCAGKRPSVTNRLDTTHPEIAAEWHPSRNGSLQPSEVTRGDPRRVWWQCPNGHDWEATVNNRTNPRHLSACPQCGLTQSSIQQVRLVAELARFLDVDLDGASLRTARRRYPVDAFDPGRRLILEFDSAYWHAPKAQLAADRRKAKEFREAGFLFIRLREAPLRKLDARFDLVVSTTDAHQLAVLTLRHIETLTGETFTGLDAYQEQGQARAGEAVTEYLASRVDRPDTCVVEGCPEPAGVRNMCAVHYKRWTTHGDAQAELPVRAYVVGGDRCVHPNAFDVTISSMRGPAAAQAAAAVRAIHADSLEDTELEVAGGRCGERTVALRLCKRHHSRFDYLVPPGDRRQGVPELMQLAAAILAALDARAHQPTQCQWPQDLDTLMDTPEDQAIAREIQDALLEDAAADAAGERCSRKHQARGLCSSHYQRWNALPTGERDDPTPLDALIRAHIRTLPRPAGQRDGRRLA